MSPMFDVRGNAIGVIMVAENVTNQVRMRDELEGAYEQLQAANEELETTNEELQSTNEELETTNEELQSTNEELETTNEELQSTNEELATTNDELAVRTSELSTLTLYYSSVLGHLDSPVVVVDTDCLITTWNPYAEQFYGLKASDVIGRNFSDLNLPVRVPRSRERLRLVMDKCRTYESRPVTYKTRTGEQRKVVLRYQPLVDAQGACRGVLVTARDARSQPLEPAAPA